MLDVNRTGVLERLSKAVAGPESADAEVMRLRLRGTDTVHTMVVLREGAPRLEPRLIAAKARWTLTRRQTEVLGHLVRGASNKSIAAALTCTVNTVEQHVTELLRRSDLESRSALVAAFWTQ
jgi:DNA-binding NarL/FixJ family response regulator